MHPFDIQAALKKAGTTQAKIAGEIGVTPMAVSLVVRGIMPSERIRRAVAAALGKNPIQVFPKYYNSSIKRRRKAA